MMPLHIQLTESTLRRVIKRLHFPLEIMLVCVRWYAAYPLSLRNLEEMMAERGVRVDHATVHRWALKILPVMAAVFRRRKLPVGPSWRVDETYVRVGGQWNAATTSMPEPATVALLGLAAVGAFARRRRDVSFAPT